MSLSHSNVNMYGFEWGKNLLYLDNTIYKVNLILAFHRNYRRPVRFPHILHEEDDIKSIHWSSAIGGQTQKPSVLL